MVMAWVCFWVNQQGYSLVVEWECSLEVGTGVVLGDGTGVANEGGFPLGVVDPGPPMDASSGFGVLAPWPCPGEVCCL